MRRVYKKTTHSSIQFYTRLLKMTFFPIVFLLAVVCLAVAVEGQTTQKPTTTRTTTKKPTTTAKTTTKTTARTTTTLVKPTSKTTSKTTTTTTSKTTTTKPVTSTATTKPSGSTTVRTTSTQPATTTTTAKPTTVKTTTSVKTTTRTTTSPKTTTTLKPTTTSRTTTIRATSSPNTTTAKPSTVSTTKPTTTTTSKKTTAGTTPGSPSTTISKSSGTSSSSTTKAPTTTRTTSTTLVPPTTARTTAAPTTSTGQTETSSTSATASSETTTVTAASSTLWTTAAETITPPSPVLWNCAVSDSACGSMCTNVTSAGGVVQSPNFPGDYGNSSRYCIVTITAPAGWMLNLNFTVFNVETNAAIVAVYDDYMFLLPSLTGNTIPALVPATVGTMGIAFQVLDSGKPSTAIYNWQATVSVTSQGNYCAVNDPACGNMCNNVTSAGTGVVQSPNFPADYGNEKRSCIVTVIVPAGNRIRLTFTTFNVETDVGYVYVGDSSTYLLSGVTGNTIPAVVTTASNIMYVQFLVGASTKPNTTTDNWQATYAAVMGDTTRTTGTTTATPWPVLVTCSADNLNGGSEACGNMCTNATSTEGVAQSPNFPGEYGNSSRFCLVTISAPAGWIINLTFTTFNVETDYGSISVSDTNMLLLSDATGSTIPPVATATSNVMHIVFLTYSSNQHNNTTTYNWQATYTAVTV